MRGFRVLSADALRYETFANAKPGDPRVALDACLKCSPLVELLVMIASSVDCYRGPSGDAAVVRERTAIRSGIAFDTVVVDRPDVGAMALRALDGVFGFQFKESRDGSVMLLECNPRVQGTMVTSVLAGANVVGQRSTIRPATALDSRSAPSVLGRVDDAVHGSASSEARSGTREQSSSTLMTPSTTPPPSRRRPIKRWQRSSLASVRLRLPRRSSTRRTPV